MPKPKVDVNRRAGPAASAAASTGGRAKSSNDFVATVATIGAVAAGAALFEVALVPGLLIGGAAVLAPKYLPRLRRRLRPLVNSAVRRASGPVASQAAAPRVRAPLAAPARLGVKQAIAKTITFRIIVTTLDFTVNYVVLGEVGTAAGLSAFALVVGPVFYLVHETAWNYLGADDKRVELSALLSLRPQSKARPAALGGWTISRALAKTITFRTIATTIDFTTNFVVVGDLATAAALSASGFVLGPFVYLGHEMAWDYYGSPRHNTGDPAVTMKLLPAPA